MSETTQRSHQHQTLARDGICHEPELYWKRAHKDLRFWIAFTPMFAAFTIYVMSDNLAFLPHGPRPLPASEGSRR